MTALAPLRGAGPLDDRWHATSRKGQEQMFNGIPCRLFIASRRSRQGSADVFHFLGIHGSDEMFEVVLINRLYMVEINGGIPFESFIDSDNHLTWSASNC